MASSATSSTSAATPTRPTSFVTQPGHETVNDEPAHTDPSLPVAGGAPHRPTPPPPDDRHAAAAPPAAKPHAAPASSPPTTPPGNAVPRRKGNGDPNRPPADTGHPQRPSVRHISASKCA